MTEQLNWTELGYLVVSLGLPSIGVSTCSEAAWFLCIV